MDTIIRLFGTGALLFALAALAPEEAAAQGCGPDGLQESGSIYRICMPAPADYNNRLVIWAHGFQDATEPVGIPEDQLCFAGICLDQLFNALGYGFATNSYSKTGLAIVQGAAVILDLIDIYAAEQGVPERVYLVGASEGGIITTLLTEQNPASIDGGVAACGPIGDFNRQLEYFGSSRLVFEVLWPGLIPGGPFNEPEEIAETWPAFFDSVIRPTLEASPALFREWVVAARLPFDSADYLNTALNSAEAVLRYTIVNDADAIETLGGFPFDNTDRVYQGRLLTDYINANVERVVADAAALAEIEANYQTSGDLDRPLITMHTTRDEQVPYFHSPLYSVKTLLSGDLLLNHLPIDYDRYGHCNFSAAESLLSFAVMLLYAGDLFELQGVGEILEGEELARFETLARRYGIRYRVDGRAKVLSAPPGR